MGRCGDGQPSQKEELYSSKYRYTDAENRQCKEYSNCREKPQAARSKYPENAILDRTETRLNTNIPAVKAFRDFIDRLELVDKFRNEFPREDVWTRSNRSSSASVLSTSYIDSVLVTRGDIGPLHCPDLLSIIYSNPRLIRVYLNLDKPRSSIAGY